MLNLRLAITPSGIPHLGNLFVLLLNYFLKIKIFGNIFLRFDDTNEKKNKLLNNFFIIKSLKKNGIFIKNIINQKFFLNFYIKNMLKFKKSYFNKLYFNNKILKKNLNYSFIIILKNCIIKYLDNNYGIFIYKIYLEKIILIKKNGVPTYNFSTLIDDYYNNIFIILRGKEWLNQVPFQLCLCKIKNFFFNFNHLLNINNLNGKKISKRNFSLTKNNIFLFLKNIKNFFKKNKDFKLMLLEKKKYNLKKINNFIMINLINILKITTINKIINLINIKKYFFYLLKKIKIEFSNLNFSNKILLDIKNIFFLNKIKLLIIKIKKYEFI
ncbi:glutamate--tRNA ligase family protein [Candidatus Carsonella ruddii]|uniref:glutamate--tRNA ligase family protein n=1 Tax=Carsonella ruddii TaxID=114186 RepID=UPI003D39DAD4